MSVNKASISNYSDKVELEGLKKKLLILEQKLYNESQKNLKIKKQKQKYAKSCKGKEAQRRASKKYWQKHRTGNPVGRPRTEWLEHKKIKVSPMIPHLHCTM